MDEPKHILVANTILIFQSVTQFNHSIVCFNDEDYFRCSNVRKILIYSQAISNLLRSKAFFKNDSSRPFSKN